SDSHPVAPEGNRLAAAILGVGVVAIVGLTSSNARAAWQELAVVLGLQGPPIAASANVLSEHHLEALDSMPAQAQAEFLLERSMNHYEGANREIERRLPAWRGKLDPSDRFETLFRMAINSDDLRVRVAAVEIDIL